MRKILYFALILILAACTPKKMDYQAVQENENQLDSITYALSQATISFETKKELEEKYNIQYETVKNSYTQYLVDNLDKTEAQEILSTSKWTRRLNQEQLETVLSKANSEFKETEIYTKYNDRLNNMKTSGPGNVYKDIISKDTLNNEIKLSDYIGNGKIILLDFWASWCPPCRAEMPTLVALHDQYKEENFEIVGYSLDNNEEAWKKGINNLNITWTQMSDLEGWNSSGVLSYVVQSIPCLILIDQEGKIIARENNWEEMKPAFEALLKKS